MGIPTDVSGCVHWFDGGSTFASAADGSGGTPSDAAYCRYISDRSGAGTLWRFNSVGNPLTYIASGINGLPCVTGRIGGDDTSNLVNTGLATPAWGDFTIFMAIQRYGSGAIANARLLDKTFNTGMWLGRSNANTGWTGGVLGTATSLDPTVDTAPQILCVRRSNYATTSDVDVWLNGETLHSTGTTATGLTDTQPLALGAWYNAAGPNATSASSSVMAACVIYLRSLSTPERATTWNYLGTQYAITLSGVGGAGAPRFSLDALGLDSLRGIH
jgi:hypothetical protein